MSSNEFCNDSSTSSDEILNQFYEENEEDDTTIELLITTPNLYPQPQNPTPFRHRLTIERNREIGEEQLYNDYFAENPTYPPHKFRTRYRMNKHLFIRIVDALSQHDQFFTRRPDAKGRFGFTALTKCTAASRILSYGASADSLDENLRIGETTVRDCVKHFVEGVIAIFGPRYLRKPNEEDIAKLLSVGGQRGFPGMVGSIDCMHWEWKNCPTGWAGQFAGRSRKSTIILEAVASHDLWIWHAFFGTPGSQNDINVLQRSPVFDEVLEGRAPRVNFAVNGNQYNMTYYLTDGIYPKWATFVKSINAPQIRKHKLFAQYQEAVRKDVERAFGVLQARFAYIKRPCLIWDRGMMGKILMACIIMHNMIVEDERDTYLNQYNTNVHLEDEDEVGYIEPLQYSTTSSNLQTYIATRTQLRSRETHNALKNDLIEHIWEKFGHRN